MRNIDIRYETTVARAGFAAIVGRADRLSPDGRWLVSLLGGKSLVVIDTDSATAVARATIGSSRLRKATTLAPRFPPRLVFLRDGQRLAVQLAHDPGKPPATYLLSLPHLRPLSLPDTLSRDIWTASADDLLLRRRFHIAGPSNPAMTGWYSVLDVSASGRYLVVQADSGRPGLFVLDRHSRKWIDPAAAYPDSPTVYPQFAGQTDRIWMLVGTPVYSATPQTMAVVVHELPSMKRVFRKTIGFNEYLVQFAADGNRLALGGTQIDDAVTVVDLASGKPVGTFNLATYRAQHRLQPQQWSYRSYGALIAAAIGSVVMLLWRRRRADAAQAATLLATLLVGVAFFHETDYAAFRNLAMIRWSNVTLVAIIPVVALFSAWWIARGPGRAGARLLHGTILMTLLLRLPRGTGFQTLDFLIAPLWIGLIAAGAYLAIGVVAYYRRSRLVPSTGPISSGIAPRFRVTLGELLLLVAAFAPVTIVLRNAYLGFGFPWPEGEEWWKIALSGASLGAVLRLAEAIAMRTPRSRKQRLLLGAALIQITFSLVLIVVWGVHQTFRAPDRLPPDWFWLVTLAGAALCISVLAPWPPETSVGRR